MVNDDEKEPEAVVDTITPLEPSGAGPQDTGVLFPATAIATVGWLGSLLHSKIAPSELAAEPEADTVTDVEPVG